MSFHPRHFGLFTNLHPEHGFGPWIGDIEKWTKGAPLAYVDVHSVPAEVATQANISDWLTILGEICIQTVWAGFPGETYESIAHTHGYGLVPIKTRDANVAELLRVISLAHQLQAQAVGLHIGHLTGRDMDGYEGLVDTVRELANRCDLQGGIVLETGQEPADVLLEFLEDVNSDELAINFDPANMIMYASGDPMAAFRKVAKYVRSIHCKDAKSAPEKERGVKFGTQVSLGEGEVGGKGKFPAFLRLAKQLCPNAPRIVEFEKFDGSHGNDQHWREITTQLGFMHGAI